MIKHFRKADIILISGLVLLSLAGLLLMRGGAGDMLTVRHDGKIVYEGSLDEDECIVIDGAYHNVIVIENGEARMQESDCPGGDCMRQGAVSRTGERIACAPNGVIITVSGDSDESGVDAVAG